MTSLVHPSVRPSVAVIPLQCHLIWPRATFCLRCRPPLSRLMLSGGALSFGFLLALFRLFFVRYELLVVIVIMTMAPTAS